MIATRGLCLDLGTTTGWAADDPNGGSKPLAGIWACAQDELGATLGELEAQLIAAIRMLEPAYVAKEAAVAIRWGRTNADASRVLFGMAGVVDLTTWRLGLPCYDVHLSTARKYFVGNARANKSDIWHACKIAGWPAGDLNACDAICVLAYARSCFGTHQLLGKTIDAAQAPAR